MNRKKSAVETIDNMRVPESPRRYLPMREIVIGLVHYCLFLFMGVVMNVAMPTQSPDFELVWACRLIAFRFGCYSAIHVVDYAWRYENGWTEVKVLLAILFVIMVAAQAYWLFA